MKRSTFNSWRELKVGGLILFALGIIGVALYRLGKEFLGDH